MANDQLYYYCGIDSAMKICKDQKLWMSHFTGMNDYGEIIFALESHCRVDNKYHELETILKRHLHHYDIQMTCLSEEPNLLSQWAMYAEDATGFAIGLSTAELSRRTRTLDTTTISTINAIFSPAREPDVFLAKVDYLEDEPDSFLMDLLEQLQHLLVDEIKINDLGGGLAKRHPDFFAIEQKVLGRSSMLKSSAFKAENECRLLRFHTLPEDTIGWPALKFRKTKYGITWYEEFGIGDCIASLRRGPKNRVENSILYRFLVDCGLDPRNSGFYLTAGTSFR